LRIRRLTVSKAILDELRGLAKADSQRMVAARIGITAQYFNDLLLGNRDLSDGVLDKLSVAVQKGTL